MALRRHRHRLRVNAQRTHTGCHVRVVARILQFIRIRVVLAVGTHIRHTRGSGRDCQLVAGRQREHLAVTICISLN